MRPRRVPTSAHNATNGSREYRPMQKSPLTPCPGSEFPRLAIGVEILRAEDKMVDEIDSHRLGSGIEFSCERIIFRGRVRIAGRMIVVDDHAGRRVRQRGQDDVARRYRDAAKAP